MAIMDRVRRGEHDLGGLPDDLRAVVSAALDPDPARRPAIREIIARLGGDDTSAPPTPRPTVDDPFTLPLALVAQDEAAAPTAASRRTPVARPDEPYDQTRDPAYDRPARTRHLPAERPWGPEGVEGEDPDELPVDLEPAPARESTAMVLRRGVVVAAFGLVVGAATAAWPYWALVLALGGSWLLRTCTMTVTAHGDRRRLRGARWYDVLLAPLTAPWYVVAAVPGALLLATWALGIGIAGALLCYAAGLSTAATLFVTGLCVATGLWVGPGAAHVRWPVRLVAHAIARRTGRWAVLTVVLVALAGFLGHQASLESGWSPFGRPPLIGR